MGATYYGKNISKNEWWVSQEIEEGVSFDQLRTGIGSTNRIYQKWDYQWTEAKLDNFTSWLRAQGVRHLDVWRTDLDALNATDGTEDWVYAATKRWLAD